VGSRAGPVTAESEQFLNPIGNRTPAVQPVAIPTKLFRHHSKFNRNLILYYYHASEYGLKEPKHIPLYNKI
jgi:hypothetical protein